MSIRAYIKNPLSMVVPLGRRGCFKWMNDEQYLKMAFYCCMHKKLNINNPNTFSEKMQWLKLYDRNPIYSKIVDKVEAKKYAASIIGEQYIIPTLGVWDSFDKIDFSLLPNKFVLKCTHDSGGIVICKDKGTWAPDAARNKISKCFSRNYYWGGREWPYKELKPRIIAEKYLEEKETNEENQKISSLYNDNSVNGLTDYKFHCFHGTPKVILVCQDRQSKEGMKEDFFNSEWKHLEVSRPFMKKAEKNIPKPKKFDEMCDLAKKLAGNIPFVRADFYEVNGKVFFGELTLYPASGLKPFIPESFDMEMGNWINLNKHI